MMQVTQEARGDWTVVAVSGRVDSETADDLEAALRTAVTAGGKVAVDLSSVDYISSAGLRALIQGARAAQGESAQFAVCRAAKSVQKVFDMSGLQHIITIQGELPC